MLRNPKIGLLTLVSAAVLFAAHAGGLFGVAPPSPGAAVEGADAPCAVTDAGPDQPSVGAYGNDSLSTILWPEGTVVFRPGGPGAVHADGSLGIDFSWERHVQGRLTVEGRRLDAAAAALDARVADGYGETGPQAVELRFPTTGCWAVTGRIGDASLTFVTRVVKVGDGPSGD